MSVQASAAVHTLIEKFFRQAAGDTDTSRDYEYTDWVALDRFVEEFSGDIKALDLAAEIPESRQ